MTNTLVRPVEKMRRVNDLISESLVVGGREEPVPFFCECGDADCYRAVWLSPVRFTEETSDPQWSAIAAEHGPAAASAAERPFALHGEGWG